jgi:hypothetical protein
VAKIEAVRWLTPSRECHRGGLGVQGEGSTGIIAFRNYWARSLKEKDPSGGHIDLWNGNRLTISSGEGLLGVIGRGIGVHSAHFPGTTYGYSDLRKATEILFWEIK